MKQSKRLTQKQRPGHRATMAARGAWIIVVLAAIGGCYAHQRSVPASSRPPEARAPTRPSLPRPQSGEYEVVGPRGPVGVERFTVTATSGRWRLEGRRSTAGGEEGYALVVDLASAEPMAFTVWRRFDELERRLEGRRRDGWFELNGSGIGGASAKRIPYAAGTMIDAPSPTFKAAILALLGPDLVPGRAIHVRTIRVDGVYLAPRVTLSTFEGRGARDGRRLVRLLRRDAPPTGLWVREDGWPTRMRVLGADRRPAWRWRLRTSTAAADAGGPAR